MVPAVGGFDWATVVAAAITAAASIAAVVVSAKLAQRAALAAQNKTGKALEKLFRPVHAAGEAVATPELVELALIGWATVEGGPSAGAKMADAVREVHSSSVEPTDRAKQAG